MLVPWQHPDSTPYSSIDQLVYFIDKYAHTDPPSSFPTLHASASTNVTFPSNAPLGLRFIQVHRPSSAQIVLVDDIIIPNAFNHTVPRHAQLMRINGVDVGHLSAAGLDLVLREIQHLKRHCVFSSPPCPISSPPLRHGSSTAIPLLDVVIASPSPHDDHTSPSCWLHFLGHAGESSFPHRTLAMPCHVMDVACGPRHILLRSSSGRLFSFGSGDSGRLGHGDVLSRLDPTLIQALRSQVVVGVACGRDHSAVVCASGLAYTFGWGEGGRLGVGHDAGDVLWPTQVVLPNAVRGFHLVAAGREATVLVSRCGRVFVCGLAHVGPTAHALHLAPHHLDGCDDENAGAGGIVSVKAGDAHCVVRMSDGSLYTWGDGASGALGHGDLLTKVHPTKVPGLPSVQKVVCGAWHTACLTTQGHVWVWGDTMGSSTSSPTRIGNKSASIDEDNPVCYRDVACGGDGAMFVQRHDHTVWSWQGDNSGEQRTATRVWPPAVTNDNEHVATTYQAAAATLKLDASGAYAVVRQPCPLKRGKLGHE